MYKLAKKDINITYTLKKIIINEKIITIIIIIIINCSKTS